MSECSRCRLSAILWNTLFIFARQFIFITFAFGQKCQEVSIIHNFSCLLWLWWVLINKKYIYCVCVSRILRATYTVQIQRRRIKSLCYLYQRNSRLRSLISLLKTFAWSFGGFFYTFFCLVSFKFCMTLCVFTTFLINCISNVKVTQ